MRPHAGFEAALVALADVAKRLKLRWYVFGAQAANFHGFPRTTQDIDITVDLGARTTRELVQALADAGFRPRFGDDAFITASHVIPVFHADSSIPIDVVLAGPGIEQLFLDEVETRLLLRRRIPYLGFAHLIVTKVLAGRPQDLVDVQELLAIQRATVPVDGIRGLLAMIEEGLDEHDLVPRFDALLKASRAGPSSSPRTRRPSKSRRP